MASTLAAETKKTGRFHGFYFECSVRKSIRKNSATRKNCHFHDCVYSSSSHKIANNSKKERARVAKFCRNMRTNVIKRDHAETRNFFCRLIGGFRVDGHICLWRECGNDSKWHCWWLIQCCTTWCNCLCPPKHPELGRLCEKQVQQMF